MPRAVWSGTVSFGLVTIPVRLYPATEPKDVRFHLMDQHGRRVRYRRVVGWEPPPEVEEVSEPPQPRAERFEPPTAPDGGEHDDARTADAGRPAEEEVEYGALMRGFETDDGRVVLLSQDEIEQVRPEPSRAIEIEAFVELRDIDPVYFEKSYVVAPQRGAEKPYALLLRAIERSGRIGIGRFVLRTKPHLVAIRPRDGAIGLETLFFGDEVRDPRSLVPGIDGVDVSERELELAETLIKTLETEWDPAAYADTYRAELLKKIAEKTPVEREEDRELEAEAPSRRAEELMDALKASVEAAKKAKKRPSRKRPA
ncbi:MAG: non-homologous end joining protein Ku [Actinomycetota bacterium]